MSSSSHRLAAITVALLGLIPASASGSPDAELGRRIYREGILPSGQPVEGTVVGDVNLRGAQVTCTACHRRSGFGTSEGGAFVPPIVAPWLFGTDPPGRADLFSKLFQEVQGEQVRAKLRAQQVRPPYSAPTLAAALRDGRDPNGRPFDAVMPRYRLSDADMAHLVAYLETLGAVDDPGVDDTTVHFATVITPDVSSERRRAMLEVMRAYFEWKNDDTEGQRQRPGHSPWHRDDFYRALRRWQLHVWQLEGPSATWGDQLTDLYREQPVFALLGGLGDNDWRPVHDFCERQAVPCLFPSTERPAVAEAGAYALYLSRGPAVEAEALATHLRQAAKQAEGATRVLQIHRDSGASRLAADALRRALRDAEAIDLRSHELAANESLDAAAWQHVLGEQQLGEREPAVLVLWLAEVDWQALAEVPPIARPESIVLSYSLLGESLPQVPESLSESVRLTYRFALPGREVPRIYRVRGWMRSRQLATTHERLRLETYFALSIADHAIDHLVESFSRDYFIENVEHEAENALNPGVYPHLSLGPGQRFASKGSYVVRLTDGKIEPVSPWIVP